MSNRISNEYVDVIKNLPTRPTQRDDDLQTLFDKASNKCIEEINKMDDEIKAKADKNEIPDTSNFATKDEIPSLNGYATETYVNSQGFLKEHQSLSEYAKKSELPNLTPYALKTEIPDISNKADKSEIPDVSNLATKSELDGKSNVGHTHSQYLTQQDINGKQDKLVAGDNITITGNVISSQGGGAEYDDTELRGLIANKSDIGHTHSQYVQTTDSRLSDARTPITHTHTKSQITDFPSIPTVPTNVSAFTNDANYVTTDDTRLSNARTPLSHTHSATEVKYGETLSFTIKKNVYINNSNGSEITYSGWDDTDYIDISGHSKIYCNTNNQWGAWYKSDKTFLSGANFTNVDYLNVPTNAKYLRVSGTSSIIASLSITTSQDTIASVIETKADKSEIPDTSNFVLTTDSRLSDSRTPKSHTHTKSEITDFPDISGGMTPIIVDLDNDDTTYASGVWTYTGLTSWDDVPDGQIFIMPIATSDSSAKQLKIGSVSKSIYRYGTSTVTNQYGVGIIVCFYSAKKSALYVSDYDSNTNYYNYVSTTSASTVAKVIQNPLGATYIPVVGELFPVYISVTNTANNPTCQSKPIFVEGVKITTTNKGDLLRGSWMAYLASDGLYLTHQGLPTKYLDTLPFAKNIEIATTSEINTLWENA